MYVESDTNMTKKLNRRQMLRLSATTVAGAVLVACTPAQPGAQQAQGSQGAAVPVVAKTPIVATTQMGLAQWDPTLQRVKDKIPNIELKITQTAMPGGWSGYSDQVVTQIAGGEQLDVIMIAIEGLRLLTNRKILTPLDDFFAKDAEQQKILMNDIHKTLREMLQVDGKQMEYPFSWNNEVIYYNTKIFQDKSIDPPKPDWSWDDFLGICQKIADVKGTANDLYAYSFPGASMFAMCAWYYNNNTSPISDDWLSSNVNDPKVAETLQYLADLILKYKVSPNPSGWDEAAQFDGGHVAMRTCGRWCIAGSMTDNFTDYDLQYQPHRDGPLKTVAGTDGWGIATSSKHPDEAWEVVKLLSGTDASIDMVKSGGNIPALKSVAEMPVFKEFGPANTAIFYASLEYAKTVAAPTNFNIVEPILDRHYQTIWSGEKTVQEALNAASEELKPEMDKLKKS